MIDEFAARFVYFYAGYLLANFVFTFARDVQDHAVVALVGVALWALVNGAATYAGVAGWPVHVAGVRLCRLRAPSSPSARCWRRCAGSTAIRFCGEHSLVVYLAFFLPMAASRIVLLKTGIITDIGTISLIVTICGVVGALALWWGARNIGAQLPVRSPGRILADAKAARRAAGGGIIGCCRRLASRTKRHSASDDRSIFLRYNAIKSNI